MKGIFKPTNPKKYKGNSSNIHYRSSWELKLMQRLDRDPRFIQWQSEEVVVPYRSPVDKRIHRYYPDFIVWTVNNEVMMVEVKPHKETMPPMLAEGKKMTAAHK